MRKVIFFSTLLAVALLSSHTDARACSMPSYDVGPPAQDLGFDAVESPADPVITEAIVYDHTIDDGGMFGCGGGSSCDGVRTRLTRLAIAPNADIDRVRVEYEDGTVTHARWGYDTPDVVQAQLSYTMSLPYDVTVSLYDVDGYESGRITVTVTETTEEWASAPKRKRGRSFLLALTLCGLVSAASYLRRRES